MKKEVSSNTMTELLGLDPEVRRELAHALLADNQRDEDMSTGGLSQLREEAEELYQSCERMRAVAISFAQTYIDPSHAVQAVAASPEHYVNLYNALLFMIADTTSAAEEMESKASRLWRSCRGEA